MGSMSHEDLENLWNLFPAQPKLFEDASIVYDQFDAQSWVDTVRVETNGLLDIDATAERLGVPVHRELPLGRDGRPSGLELNIGSCQYGSNFVQSA
jgi:hypothetical protein